MQRSKWIELIDGVSPAKIAKEYAATIGIKLTKEQLTTIMSTYSSSTLLIEQCVNIIIVEIFQTKLSPTT